ncbi:MAG: N-acetyl-alpha-D-glucosaminyl L-malate synthase BshA [Bacteroidota bacterium]
MKIGIVCYPTFGGSGVVATELGMALAQKGHQVHFITYDRPVRLRGFSENVHYEPVRAEEYPLFDFVPYESALVSKMVEVTQREKLDLLHVHYAIPHASAAYMAQQILKETCCNIPTVLTLHGTDITLVGREAAYKPIVQFSINQSSAVTAVSQSLADDTYANFEIDRDIQVIPNFVELERFEKVREKGMKSKLFQDDEPVLIHVSNFRPVKRVMDVMEIFCKVRQQRPVKMVFVGDGPDRSQLLDIVREKNLMGSVIFLGKQEAIEYILPMGHVFVMPSESESFGLAALEAMASGLPVIATNTGGVPELVQQGECGFLSDVGDTDDMAANTLKLLESPETYKRHRKNALKRAKTFSIENVVPLYENLYQSVIKTKTPA